MSGIDISKAGEATAREATALQAQARREGWTADEIEAVTGECDRAESYDKLLQILIANTTGEDSEDEDEE